jgi:hypothetical protein
MIIVKDMKAKFLVLIIIFIIGCKKDKIENLNYSRDIHVYYYEGSGWTGWRYELNIDSTGLMSVYERIRLPKEFERKINYLLLSEELDSIKQDLIKLSKIKLKDYGFGPGKPTDLPTSFIKYRLSTYYDSSGIYCPEKDEILNELLTVLDRINSLRIKYDKKE